MGPIISAQLRENAADVALDGCFLNGELVRNLLIGITSGDQAQHINFARAQLILGSVLSQLRRDFGRYSLVSSMDTPDRVQQFSAYVSLQDVSPSTRFDGAQDLNIPGISRQYDDLGVREFVSDPVDG